jgi:hypothetical protein
MDASLVGSRFCGLGPGFALVDAAQPRFLIDVEQNGAATACRAY